MIDYPDFQLSNTQISSQENAYIKKVLNDYWIACISREASLMGRREVLTGKAKFGILGDGKEIPQVALAHFFNKGDFRSGYYRDQTLMFALDLSTVEQYFAQLYADAENDPFSGGRQMNSHYATPMKDENDQWLRQTELYNISADISSTGGQMSRSLGLASASKIYRNLKDLDPDSQFSTDGNEITFCTIGDASTSEGIFWETLNAASVSQVPLAILVWDDGYGISVPIEMQTTKSSISKAAEGFLLDEFGNGIHMYTVKAWDYPALINVFDRATNLIREEHRTVLIHVQDCTQPQGHSTSGSHERYKSKERLEWEKEFDGITKMGDWLKEMEFCAQEDLDKIQAEARDFVKTAKKNAWSTFQKKIKEDQKKVIAMFKAVDLDNDMIELVRHLEENRNPTKGDVISCLRRVRQNLISRGLAVPEVFDTHIEATMDQADIDYHSHLYSEADSSALNIPVVHPEFSENSEIKNGYEVINTFFDRIFEKHPNTLAFGEDVGNIGDVNQGFAGLQDKYGDTRIFDTGIREWSIVGQAIGLSMRGFRPIAEMQYIDYLIYGLAAMSDDLATVRYRSNNLQMAPAIIRTRGHRLEGIWHAGSPLGMMLNSLKGMYICVPRNFVQAAGMYNTLLQSTDPGVVVEVLNAYRRKERMPDNIGEYTVPLGVPEKITEGEDLTIVTYGVNVRLAEEAINSISAMGYTIELIDVQTMIPFDLEHSIVESLKKTNRILFIDEDVPGGSTSFMMQKVLEEQGGYYYLDAKPATLSSYDHRTPFGSDGDYFTKPQVEDIVDKIIEIIEE
ncbi:MAG: transketolase [Saprospiraceae bacterium]|nr:transketolase [Bacteroidia bacterium]NNK90111.1 transketolase [Saprospiraceae bacterium]